MTKEFKAKIVNVKLKENPKSQECMHRYKSLWSDYYSWIVKCVWCGNSKSGEY